MCTILLKGEWLIKSPLCLAAPWEWLDIGAPSNFEFWSRIWKNTESPLTMALISIWSWRRNKKLGPGMDSMPKPHLPIHILCSITILQLRLIALCPSWMKNSDKCTAHWCFVFSDEKVTNFSQTLKRKEKGGARFVPSSSFRPVDAISMHGVENPGYFIQQKIFTGNPRNPWKPWKLPKQWQKKSTWRLWNLKGPCTHRDQAQWSSWCILF